MLPERLVMLSERLAAVEKFYFPYIERREKGEGGNTGKSLRDLTLRHLEHG